jgi:hypothetical protein
MSYHTVWVKDNEDLLRPFICGGQISDKYNTCNPIVQLQNAFKFHQARPRRIVEFRLLQNEGRGWADLGSESQAYKPSPHHTKVQLPSGASFITVSMFDAFSDPAATH